MQKPASPRNRLRGGDRTRIACRRCNSKKVKCDASAGVPCRGCVGARAECVPIDSKRGRYVRHKARPPGIETPRNNMPRSSPTTREQSPRGNTTRSSSATRDQSPLLRGVNHEDESPSTAAWTTSRTELVDSHLLRGLSRSFEKRAPKDSSAMFYLHIADQSVRPTQQPINNAMSTFYAGDSFSLTYAIHDVLAPFMGDRQNYQKRLHFPIAEGFDPSDLGRENIVNAQVQLLRERNILHRLGPDALERMLSVYFSWFHPAFPLMSEAGFLRKCLRNQMSLLVLNALLLVAATICDNADIPLTGCSSRQRARKVFYRQAKALYDSDLDPDKVNNVISVFLMSFWWGGSHDEKDTWHWLGIAVNLAQSLGMHRLTARSHMSDETSKLWRRIWWCLRVRDTLTSGSIGRPQHISDRDCDVEMLEPGDMLGEDWSTECEKKHYACQMAQLSLLLSSIITSRYAAIQSSTMEQKIQLEHNLDRFRTQIPLSLQYKGIDSGTGQGLWSAMLLMAYNFGVILLCRPPRSTGEEANLMIWGNRPKAVAAANEITRIMEDILSTSLVRLCQIHTIPALFNSLSMHVFSLCTSGTVGRELAENRARTCMLGLTCLQESWPVSGWILKLFVDIMERLRRKLTTHTRAAGLIALGSGSSTIPGSSVGFSQHPQRVMVSSTKQSSTASEPTDGNPHGRNLEAIYADNSSHNIPKSSTNTGNTEVLAFSNDHNAFSSTSTGLFPNLFVLDGVFSDLNTEQMNFFDQLEVPNYYDLNKTSY
ncbi:Cutinase transcription factor 1 alpha [Tolypocladium ophioglossoides CBS 100239]|uniref:Cutinase transcription factor 1 alpha n=1 Tax=Tolypocladium ophioglossoides (strain CBS 100239) TaxID=1163406 RepID=A0A0L0MZA2_TOLOC|nr:Cutinase transcription factor 1 alpha [Tolypocladium ophioglossoides CBS 100239]